MLPAAGPLLVVCAALTATSCAGTAQERAAVPPPSSPAVVRVVDGDTGAVLYDGPSTYAWRKDERTAQLQGFGELVVGDAQGTDRCRLVDVRQGLGTLIVFERAPCGVVAQKAGRVCFPAGPFARTDGAPGQRIVGGCVDENDLLWRKVDEAAAPSVGPTRYHRICEAVPTQRGCPLVYLRVDALEVESNPTPMAGASIAFEEGDWRVCWLEAHRGVARITYTARTSCDERDRATTLVRDGADAR
jgi:hypothetical protein